MFGIFVFTLSLGTFILFRFSGSISWNILPAGNLFEIAQFVLFFTSIAVGYILSYPAVEVDSPTLIIIKAVSDAGRNGIEKDRLKELVNNDLLIIPRVKDMLSDKMVYLIDGKYKLTGKGLIMARVFSIYRDFMRLGKGG